MVLLFYFIIKHQIVTFAKTHLAMNIFGLSISKSSNVEKRLNEQFVSAFASQLASAVRGLDFALPTINADGYDYINNSFKTIGAVYETTDLISKKVINTPIVFYNVRDAKKLKQAKQIEKEQPIAAYLMKLQAIEEVDNKYLSELIANPNPYQNTSQFLWTIALSYLLTGNAYIYTLKGERKTKQMWCIPNMDILADENNLLDPILGYRMIFENSPFRRFEKDEIKHLKTGNPANIDRTFQYLYGVSPLRAYLEAMRTIQEAKTQASKQAKNGGVFGILSPKDKEDELGKEQKQQLQEKMKEARQSNDELSRVFPSAIALAWQSIGLPIADLQLLELVSTNEEDIYRAFHVPLSFHNQKASTDNNVGTEVRKLIWDAVAPVCDVISELLTAIGKEYGVDSVKLDYTQLPEMAINMKEVAEYLKSIPEGTLTPNEMRAALRYGEKSEAYLNEHYINKGKVTMKSVANGNAPTN